ncbi:hypothetical protein HK100_010948, partial [Physocladia obscura]
MDLTMNTEETIALDEAVRRLIAQQQALQQAIANQETNLEAFQRTITEQNQVINLLTDKLNALDPTIGSSQNFTTGLNSSQKRVPDFKMPSVKPLEYSGIFKSRAAHELQNSLDDYLDCSLEICQLTDKVGLLICEGQVNGYPAKILIDSGVDGVFPRTRRRQYRQKWSGPPDDWTSKYKLAKRSLPPGDRTQSGNQGNG